MIFFGISLGIGILVGMIYMALNKKSDFVIRIACIAAIFLMILTVVICLILALTDNRVPVDESVLIVGAVTETQGRNTSNDLVLTLLIMFLVVFFLLIAIFSMREHHKSFPKKN